MANSARNLSSSTTLCQPPCPGQLWLQSPYRRSRNQPTACASRLPLLSLSLFLSACVCSQPAHHRSSEQLLPACISSQPLPLSSYARLDPLYILISLAPRQLSSSVRRRHISLAIYLPHPLHHVSLPEPRACIC